MTFTQIPTLATKEQLNAHMSEREADNRKREARNGVYAGEIAALEATAATALERARSVIDEAEHNDPCGPRTNTPAEAAAFDAAMAEHDDALSRIRLLEHSR